MAVSSSFQSALVNFFRIPKVLIDARQGLIETGQYLVKLSHFQRAENASYAVCTDAELESELLALRRDDVASLRALGFTPWHVACITFSRDSAALADRERRDLQALGEHISVTSDNRIRLHGLLLRSADGQTLASISSLSVKFFSLTKDGALLINSVLTPGGRARWSRRLSDIGMSQHEIDAALPLSDISDPRIKLFRRESTRPVTTVWQEHKTRLAAYELRGNPACRLDTFEQYVTLARRERACS